ncbi:hypothetical protein [Paenibacillus polymyxa]|uniref:hypothetical protein n=1 Tax=Paenibacillus polymyxa TaxID=1406 RepID=UPI000C9F2228|nr:hypothetical protein [Paenibacillus polymyxa]PNQ87805.1 hypothetical protein C1T20_00010 [Paenibacillus polymyxa]
MSIFEKLEFSANPRAVPFMPYGAFFEPHAAPSSHLIVRKSSLPCSRSLLIHTRRGNIQIVHRVYQYSLNIGFDKASSGAESGGTADFLLASRNPTASLTSMGGTSIVQPPNPIPNPIVKPKTVFGRLVRSKHNEAEEPEAALLLRRTMLFVVFHAWEPSSC